MGFPDGTSGKKKKKHLPANAGVSKGVCSIPGSGRSLGGEHGGICFSIFVWKMPMKWQPGRVSSIGSQRVGHD